MTRRSTMTRISSLGLLSLAVFAAAQVTTKPDGLKIEDTRHVECTRPTKDGDKISVHYKGTLLNGHVFDESWGRGTPFRFTLGLHEVISGWDEGLLDMCVGTKRMLTIPPALGYGSRHVGSIPADSTLIFETQLMHIDGVPDPTTPPADSKDGSKAEADKTAPTSQPAKSNSTIAEGSASGPEHDAPPNNECRLLGPFALIVQGALGLLAMLSLVVKRYREHPRRPVKVWFFDASKQVVGTALLHVANLAMSMLSSGSAVDAARHAAAVVEASKTPDNELPNPCSFYLLNLAIDTTIGIPVLVILLRLFHAVALRTPLARPPQSLRSGHYGNPPNVKWWMKQSLLYFLGLFGMKAFVLFLFAALPWLPWVGDWALRWTEGNEVLQIAFVMFIFPLAMNAVQYYIIDAFIKEDQGKGAAGAQGYQSVGQQDQEEEDGSGMSPGGSGEEGGEGPGMRQQRDDAAAATVGLLGEQGAGTKKGAPPPPHVPE